MNKFKIDKLGWYEARDGKKYNVLGFFKKKTDKPIIALTCEDEVIFLRNWNSEDYVFMTTDLIKYLGPELPKESEELMEFKNISYGWFLNDKLKSKSRKYEFNGYVPIENDGIDNKTLFIIFKREIIGENYKKYKITMEEIIDE